jgi:thioesterase domain-containing protein
MTGWSAVHLTLMEAGYLPSVWVAKGEVEYLKPVRGVLRASTTVTDAMREKLITEYENKGRVKANIEIVIEEEGQDAVRMKAVYVAMTPKD